MTTADVTRTVAPHAAQNLRRRVRSLLEGEYLRLRAADRPELLMSAGSAEDGVDPDVVAGEMDVVDRRVRALERHFAAVADPSAPALGRVFLLDLGDGPQLMLVSDVDVADDQVISADSPLGRALQDAVPGQLVTYQCPRQLRQARVLALEAEAADARAEWYSLPAAEVLVGFDGSPSSRTAITWAAQEAARRARPLRVLHAREELPDPAAQPDELLTEGIRLASENLQADFIRASAVDGSAGRRLTERARAAELLVVGRGGEQDADLGPVAQEVLNSTARATVVVPPRAEPKSYGRVVVGLRESGRCADALAVGLAEADRRGADLIVMLIRDGDADAPVDNTLDPVFHAPNDSDVEEAGHLPVAVAAAGRAFPGVAVSTVVRTGRFAEVLVELSHSADLVVLGMGGRPAGMGRKDLLIASHSTCPVIVVRESPIRGGI